jgi:hypothetical protein
MKELGRIEAKVRTGHERIICENTTTKFTLLDFWRWSVSDIMSNATRGRFAEFIVATATNIDLNQPRLEWGEYDLLTPGGIKLEIKSSAYIQSWFQDKVSKITFSTRAARGWDYETNKLGIEVKRHADVYVMCLLHHLDQATINPLDLSQWTFYVITTKELNDYKRSQHSITLRSLEKLTKPVAYQDLDREIRLRHSLHTPTGA